MQETCISIDQVLLRINYLDAIISKPKLTCHIKYNLHSPLTLGSLYFTKSKNTGKQ